MLSLETGVSSDLSRVEHLAEPKKREFEPNGQSETETKERKQELSGNAFVCSICGGTFLQPQTGNEFSERARRASKNETSIKLAAFMRDFRLVSSSTSLGISMSMSKSMLTTTTTTRFHFRYRNRNRLKPEMKQPQTRKRNMMKPKEVHEANGEADEAKYLLSDADRCQCSHRDPLDRATTVRTSNQRPEVAATRSSVGGCGRSRDSVGWAWRRRPTNRARRLRVLGQNWLLMLTWLLVVCRSAELADSSLAIRSARSASTTKPGDFGWTTSGAGRSPSLQQSGGGKKMGANLHWPLAQSAPQSRYEDGDKSQARRPRSKRPSAAFHFVRDQNTYLSSSLDKINTNRPTKTGETQETRPSTLAAKVYQVDSEQIINSHELLPAHLSPASLPVWRQQQQQQQWRRAESSGWSNANKKRRKKKRQLQMSPSLLDERMFSSNANEIENDNENENKSTAAQTSVSNEKQRQEPYVASSSSSSGKSTATQMRQTPAHKNRAPSLAHLQRPSSAGSRLTVDSNRSFEDEEHKYDELDFVIGMHRLLPVDLEQQLSSNEAATKLQSRRAAYVSKHDSNSSFGIAFEAFAKVEPTMNRNDDADEQLFDAAAAAAEAKAKAQVETEAETAQPSVRLYRPLMSILVDNVDDDDDNDEHSTTTTTTTTTTVLLLIDIVSSTMDVNNNKLDLKNCTQINNNNNKSRSMTTTTTRLLSFADDNNCTGSQVADDAMHPNEQPPSLSGAILNGTGSLNRLQQREQKSASRLRRQSSWLGAAKTNNHIGRQTVMSLHSPLLFTEQDAKSDTTTPEVAETAKQTSSEAAAADTETSTTSGESECEVFETIRQSMPSHLFRNLVSAAYGSVFFFGLLGNTITLLVLLKEWSTCSVIDIFIGNLALSDIMLCIFAVPITPIYMLYEGHWTFGLALCKGLSFAQCASVYISTFTLIIIAVVRYRMILHPLAWQLSRSWAFLCCLTTWSCGILITMPYLHHVSLLPQNCDIKFCDELWDGEYDRFYFSVATLFNQFFAPLGLIGYLHAGIFRRLNAQVNERRHQRAASASASASASACNQHHRKKSSIQSTLIHNVITGAAQSTSATGAHRARAATAIGGCTAPATTTRKGGATHTTVPCRHFHHRRLSSSANENQHPAEVSDRKWIHTQSWLSCCGLTAPSHVIVGDGDAVANCCSSMATPARLSGSAVETSFGHRASAVELTIARSGSSSSASLASPVPPQIHLSQSGKNPQQTLNAPAETVLRRSFSALISGELICSTTILNTTHCDKLAVARRESVSGGVDTPPPTSRARTLCLCCGWQRARSRRASEIGARGASQRPQRQQQDQSAREKYLCDDEPATTTCADNLFEGSSSRLARPSLESADIGPSIGVLSADFDDYEDDDDDAVEPSLRHHLKRPLSVSGEPKAPEVARNAANNSETPTPSLNPLGPRSLFVVEGGRGEPALRNNCNKQVAASTTDLIYCGGKGDAPETAPRAATSAEVDCNAAANKSIKSTGTILRHNNGATGSTNNNNNNNRHSGSTIAIVCNNNNPQRKQLYQKQQQQQQQHKQNQATPTPTGKLDVFALKEQREREKERRISATNWKLLLMVLLFTCSWLPLNVFNMVQDYFPKLANWPYIKHIFCVVHLVACSSVCVNPILYAWMSDNYRQKLCQVMPRKLGITSSHSSAQNHNYNSNYNHSSNQHNYLSSTYHLHNTTTNATHPSSTHTTTNTTNTNRCLTTNSN